MSKLPLAAKIGIFLVFFVAIFSAESAWLASKLTDNMNSARRNEVKSAVEAAWTIVDSYAKKAASNEMDIKLAKKAATDAIVAIRYGADKDYIWINDTTPAMVAHPFATQAAKPDWYAAGGLQEYSTPRGEKIFQMFNKVAKEKGEGFVMYHWNKAGTGDASAGTIEEKISYLKFVPEWEWIVGGGMYISDVRKETGSLIWQVGSVGVLILLITFIAGLYLIRTLTASLKNVSEVIDGGASQILTASSQSAASSQELAQGASRQAASVEEISSAIKEISVIASGNMESTAKAKDLAAEAINATCEVENSMSDMARSMDGISQATGQTQKIIKTIDDIAFQTNLLALNAAVEAARAGEAGKGFAVVAEEVRNLAKKSAEAARNTNEMIENSARSVSDGVATVEKVKHSSAVIGQKIVVITNAINEIASASEQQTAGIGQLNLAVEEIEKVTQGNSAAAEESAAAAEELSSQAAEMKSTVQKLKTTISGMYADRKQTPQG